jgi:hypothetical protein
MTTITDTAKTTLSASQIAQHVAYYDEQIAAELAIPAEDKAPNFVWMIDQRPQAKLERIAKLNESRASLMSTLKAKIA